ncbi:MAG TPA: type II toxin-antitoxin system VapC family toxin [Acetobacteraceae bacterium]|nr:type II toxin-antitoxin system VapC family toxin [Acetobacteraceae bacterium]
MIILDTNVVSEPMKPAGSSNVLRWLDQQDAETLYLTAPSLSELLTGIELLPAGRRRSSLAAALQDLLIGLFETRILPFDQSSAVAYASIAARARSGGQKISVIDGQIAAIAEVHGFTVATRDTTPFLAVGLPVLNPWQADC